MVIDHLVYDPDSSSNSALFSVVKGTFSMVGGKIADSGKMDIETPIATLGIRGTAAACGKLGSEGSFCGPVPLKGHDNKIAALDKDTGVQMALLTDDAGLVVTPAGVVPASAAQIAFLSNQGPPLQELYGGAAPSPALRSTALRTQFRSPAILEFNAAGQPAAPDPGAAQGPPPMPWRRELKKPPSSRSRHQSCHLSTTRR